MLTCRDYAIKLFGTTISLQLKESPIQVVSVGSESNEEDEKDYQRQNTTPEPKEHVAQSSDSQEDTEARDPENLKPDSSVAEDVKTANLISERHPEDTSDSKLKSLKKPDKILPCPRCKSMETKFCYYNNYNVNQPRHFCKHCQRYWTAGGTMRNVPVGAGRRKSKSIASQFRQLVTYNPTAQYVTTKIAESIPYSLKLNDSVLSFGSDSPHHISTASILNHAEKSIKTSGTSCPSTENTHSEDSKPSYSQTSAVTPCINGVPWPCTYAQIASFSGPSFAIPLYPAAAYWTCPVPPSAFTMPSISHTTSNPTDNCSKGQEASSITALGKHSRNDIMENDQETSHISSIPKTMRIGDPQEAVNSSIWNMINHKNDKADASKGVGIFRSFQINKKNHAKEGSQLLHTNPAALARSVCFQET